MRGVGVLLRIEHPDHQVGELDQPLDLEVVGRPRSSRGRAGRAAPARRALRSRPSPESSIESRWTRWRGGIPSHSSSSSAGSPPQMQAVATTWSAGVRRSRRGRAGQRVEHRRLPRTGRAGQRDDRVVGRTAAAGRRPAPTTRGLVDDPSSQPPAGGRRRPAASPLDPLVEGHRGRAPLRAPHGRTQPRCVTTRLRPRRSAGRRPAGQRPQLVGARVGQLRVRRAGRGSGALGSSSALPAWRGPCARAARRAGVRPGRRRPPPAVSGRPRALPPAMPTSAPVSAAGRGEDDDHQRDREPVDAVGQEPRGGALVGTLGADQVEHAAAASRAPSARRGRGSRARRGRGRGRRPRAARAPAATERHDASARSAASSACSRISVCSPDSTATVTRSACCGLPWTALVIRSRSQLTLVSRLRSSSPVPTNSCQRASTSPRSRVPSADASSTSRDRLVVRRVDVALAAAPGVDLGLARRRRPRGTTRQRAHGPVERLPHDAGARLRVGAELAQPVPDLRDRSGGSRPLASTGSRRR